MHQPRPNSSAYAQRLEQLASAIIAYRAGRTRCRLPRELRAQVVAMIEADVPVDAVRQACKLSAWQIASWRQSAAMSGGDASTSSEPMLESPRVLSVVDRTAREAPPVDAEIELRIGGWRVSFRREAP